MKSPPYISVGFTFMCVFDSIFKEYSDPHYLRIDATKLCILLSGGISAIKIAPFWNSPLIQVHRSATTSSIRNCSGGVSSILQNLQTRFTSCFFIKL